MYRRHFHLKERPFQLVPTPAYLYPSRCHQEALGHLRYALESGEGFVEITGEVGTGKTTLLRTFLDGLDDGVAVACIFNPTLNAVELLRSINRDFGIRASTMSRSDLTASLQRFLIENREKGRKALLVIDEAQNLSVEVLEELRLLSNLETTRTKLLQTVLCGQPELAAMLERYELRQLAQRISLSCRLRSLTPDETHRYIVHRVNMASKGDGSELFTKGARTLVYRYATGTPRIINICCDRSLLCAYVAGRKKVDRRSVKEAVAELSDRPYMVSRPLMRAFLVWGGGAFVIGMVLMVVFFLSGRFLPSSDQVMPTQVEASPELSLPTQPETRPDPPHAPTADVMTNSSRPVQAEMPSLQDDPVTWRLSDLFDETSINGSVAWGVEEIMGEWGYEIKAPELPLIVEPYLLFSAAAAPRGMEVMRVDKDLDLAWAFNLPVLVLFATGGERPLALVYEKEVGQGRLQFRSSKGVVEISDGDARLWAGQAIIAFPSPLGFSGTVTGRSPDKAVVALESALVRGGFSQVVVDGHFDEETRAAVCTLQAAYGIPVDGKAGALTRVALASMLKNGLPGSEEKGGGHGQLGEDAP